MKAIIYLPGLGVSITDQPVESITQRLRQAIDINNPDGKKKYDIEMRKATFGYNNELTTNVCTILEDGKRVTDVFEYSYAKELTDRFEKQNMLFKTLELLMTLLVNSWSVLKGITTGTGLSKKDKLQTLYVIAILTVITLFGVILISSLPAFIAQSTKLTENATLKQFINTTQIGGFIKTCFAWMIDDSGFLVGLMASLYVLMPNFRDYITGLATEFICIINYFNYGERNLSLAGKFELLLEHIEENESDYEEVIVMSYSFGSLIALDSLFPTTNNPSVRVKQRISAFITIGCPYDFVRVYWQDYYANRENKCVNLKLWINVANSVDVLSSNFRNDGKLEPADQSVGSIKSLLPTNIYYNIAPSLTLNFFSGVMLLGIRAHRMYWDESPFTASCFNNIVEELDKVGFSLLGSPDKAVPENVKIILTPKPLTV
jgi:hypothetical protein